MSWSWSSWWGSLTEINRILGEGPSPRIPHRDFWILNVNFRDTNCNLTRFVGQNLRAVRVSNFGLSRPVSVSIATSSHKLLSEIVRCCCEFRSVYTIEFWQCLRRMLCGYVYLGHASLVTIRRDFGREFTVGKFPNPPQIHCRLTPICAWMCFQWCLLHAQRCVRSFGSIAYECKTVRYWQCCVIPHVFGERLPTDVWWTACKFLPPFPWDFSFLV